MRILPPLSSAAALISQFPTLSELRHAAAACQACDLWQMGAQTVFGEGEKRAEVMFVGEQPGDQEDRVGRPFVGPAGQLLGQALRQVGVERDKLYVTNVVKHFKWEPKGKRRIHQTPNVQEITACRPWLDTEIMLVKPRVIVCLGATAAQALLGKEFRVTQQHGQFVPSPLAPFVIATVHPSSILRIPNESARVKALRQFVADLQKVADQLREPEESHRSSD